MRGGVLYFNSSSVSDQKLQQLLDQGQQRQSQHVHMGYGLGPSGPAVVVASSVGVVYVSRNSKYPLTA